MKDRSQVTAEIAQIIEDGSNGAVKDVAAEFDLDAIVAEAAVFDEHRGYVLMGTDGPEAFWSAEAFWTIVERHAR